MATLSKDMALKKLLQKKLPLPAPKSAAFRFTSLFALRFTEKMK
jgi:hypothetical protein